MALAAGLYVLLVVSWRDIGDGDPSAPALYTLIRREMHGRLLRSTASGAAIAVLIGVLLSSMLLTSGAAYSVSSTKDKLGADLLVVPVQTEISAQPFYTLTYAGGPTTPGTPSYAIPPYLNGSVTQQVASVNGVRQATPQLLVTYFVPAGGCGGLDVVYIIGVATAGNFVLESWLPGGVGQALGGNGAIAGAEVPDFSYLPSQATFYGTQLVRQAVLPRTGTFMDHVIFVSMDTAGRMRQWDSANPPSQPGALTHSDGSLLLTFKPGQVSAVFVKLGSGVDPKVEATNVGAQVSGAKAYALAALVQAVSVQFSGLLSIFSLSGALVWAGSLALVATVSSMGVNERRGEIGVIRTLGGSRVFVRRLVAGQMILTSSISGLVAILAVWVSFNSPVVYDAIIISFRIPYVPPAPSLTAFFVVLSALLVLAASAVGALFAARTSGRLDTYEAIRQGAR
jgi:putative ABC transport system permease protein